MADKPKWQRARQISFSRDDVSADRGNLEHPFWVQEIVELDGLTTFDGKFGTMVEPRYRTNVVLRDGSCGLVARRVVELLPEFADDVPLISWEEFIGAAKP